jgi:chromosome segregation ATPase
VRPVEPTTESATAPGQPSQASEVAALREQLRESEQALARLPGLEYEAELAARDRQELDEARQRIEVLDADLEKARAALERTSTALAGMQSSLSWRITAPLRALKRSR